MAASKKRSIDRRTSHSGGFHKDKAPLHDMNGNGLRVGQYQADRARLMPARVKGIPRHNRRVCTIFRQRHAA